MFLRSGNTCNTETSIVKHVSLVMWKLVKFWSYTFLWLFVSMKHYSIPFQFYSNSTLILVYATENFEKFLVYFIGLFYVLHVIPCWFTQFLLK